MKYIYNRNQYNKYEVVNEEIDSDKIDVEFGETLIGGTLHRLLGFFRSAVKGTEMKIYASQLNSLLADIVAKETSKKVEKETGVEVNQEQMNVISACWIIVYAYSTSLDNIEDTEGVKIKEMAQLVIDMEDIENLPELFEEARQNIIDAANLFENTEDVDHVEEKEEEEIDVEDNDNDPDDNDPDGNPLELDAHKKEKSLELDAHGKENNNKSLELDAHGKENKSLDAHKDGVLQIGHNDEFSKRKDEITRKIEKFKYNIKRAEENYKKCDMEKKVTKNLKKLIDNINSRINSVVGIFNDKKYSDIEKLEKCESEIPLINTYIKHLEKLFDNCGIKESNNSVGNIFNIKNINLLLFKVNKLFENDDTTLRLNQNNDGDGDDGDGDDKEDVIDNNDTTEGGGVTDDKTHEAKPVNNNIMDELIKLLNQSRLNSLIEMVIQMEKKTKITKETITKYNETSETIKIEEISDEDGKKLIKILTRAKNALFHTKPYDEIRKNQKRWYDKLENGRAINRKGYTNWVKKVNEIAVLYKSQLPDKVIVLLTDSLDKKNIGNDYVTLTQEFLGINKRGKKPSETTSKDTVDYVTGYEIGDWVIYQQITKDSAGNIVTNKGEVKKKSGDYIEVETEKNKNDGKGETTKIHLHQVKNWKSKK
tara:strand:- start:12435 stop:14387 length:1953 start_codon:yes stop_codon:yes gene_type:complete